MKNRPSPLMLQICFINFNNMPGVHQVPLHPDQPNSRFRKNLEVPEEIIKRL
jgi:hypothetical protein